MTPTEFKAKRQDMGLKGCVVFILSSALMIVAWLILNVFFQTQHIISRQAFFWLSAFWGVAAMGVSYIVSIRVVGK